MPNEVFVRLAAIGPAPEVIMFLDSVRPASFDGSSHLCLSSMIPMPSPAPSDEWFVEHWGTDREVYDVAEPAVHTMADESLAALWVFESAWEPPLTWVRHVSAAYPDIVFVMGWSEPGRTLHGVADVRAGHARVFQPDFGPNHLQDITVLASAAWEGIGLLLEPGLPWVTVPLDPGVITAADTTQFEAPLYSLVNPARIVIDMDGGPRILAVGPCEAAVDLATAEPAEVIEMWADEMSGDPLYLRSADMLRQVQAMAECPDVSPETLALLAAVGAFACANGEPAADDQCVPEEISPPTRPAAQVLSGLVSDLLDRIKTAGADSDFESLVHTPLG